MAAMTTTRTPIITIIARRSCRRIERSIAFAVRLSVSTRKGPLLDASSRCRHSTLDRSGLAGNRTRCLTSARHGRRIGAIMPADIAERYEDMEDAYWSRRAEEARGDSTRSLESVIADLEG